MPDAREVIKGVVKSSPPSHKLVECVYQALRDAGLLPEEDKGPWRVDNWQLRHEDGRLLVTRWGPERQQWTEGQVEQVCQALNNAEQGESPLTDFTEVRAERADGWHAPEPSPLDRARDECARIAAKVAGCPNAWWFVDGQAMHEVAEAGRAFLAAQAEQGKDQ